MHSAPATETLHAPTVFAPAHAQHAELMRLEEAALNATVVRQQMLYDGWLVRWAPSRAKRMRSVNVLASSARPLDERLAHCSALYARHGLPLLFRLTSLCPDPALDRAIGERGFVAYGHTRVMTRAIVAHELPNTASTLGMRQVDSGAFAAAVGMLRGSGEAEVAEHAARLAAIAVDMLPIVAHDADGTCVATALAVFDGDLMGVFDVVTLASRRGLGIATQLMHHLMACAAQRGARQAYLQVEPENIAARSLYARLGFSDRYEYWYRSLPGNTAP